MNFKNMLALATYLEDHVTQEMFDMAYFRSDEDSSSVYMYKTSELSDYDACGTIGCALGWAPWVDGMRLAPVDYDIIGKVDWTNYCERVLLIKHEQIEWGFLFDGQWNMVDNTPEGAAMRLRFLATGGNITNLDGFTNKDDILYNGNDVETYMNWSMS